jgi:hypothetical protein
MPIHDWKRVEPGIFHDFHHEWISAGLVKEAFIEPIAVGDVLPDMPLFLEPDLYVPVPLESSYRDAFDAVPERWREELEPAASL